MSTADAVARELAWLTAVDALGPLLVADGGLWDNVQAYGARTPNNRQKTVFVMRRKIHVKRVATARLMPTYGFHLVAWWPLSTSSAEVEQAAFDVAIDALLTRVNGPVLDKTHGGRFLSVAEDSAGVQVDFTPATQDALSRDARLYADVSYNADDSEVNG